MTTEQHEPMERRELEHVQAGCLDKAMVDKLTEAKQEGRGQDLTIDVSAGSSPPLGSYQPSAGQKRRGHGVGPT